MQIENKVYVILRFILCKFKIGIKIYLQNKGLRLITPTSSPLISDRLGLITPG
jgi:hypothetical protein